MSATKGRDYVIGIDFGTDSVRALVVDAADGSSAGRAVSAYGRWAKGEYCDPRSNRFRQHPLDYMEGIEDAVKRALAEAGGAVAARIARHHDRHDGLHALPRRREGPLRWR